MVRKLRIVQFYIDNWWQNQDWNTIKNYLKQQQKRETNCPRFCYFFLLLNAIIKNMHIFEAKQKFSSRLPADTKMKLCLKIKVLEHSFKVGNSNYFYKLPFLMYDSAGNC